MTLDQRRIFIATYITYASYYFARLNYSIALPSIGQELQYTKLALGTVGAAFSISYAAGQFIHGELADKIGGKKIILAGLALSAAMNLLFSHLDSLILITVVWAINGYAQSTGWPSAIKIISRRFKKDIGTVGGFFGTCFLVGNMISWPVLGYISATYGWRATFQVPALLLVLIAAIFMVTVEDKPETGHPETKVQKVHRAGSRLRRIMLSKRLITVAGAYVLLQFIRSGFTLWAPTYLLEIYSLPLDTAGYVAAVIPFGGVVGSMISGWLSDRTRKLGRSLIMSIMILCLSLTLLAFHGTASTSLQIGAIILFTSGLTLYGPHTLIATVVPMEHEESHGGASVAGFIDGIGYIGLMFADPFTGWIADMQGWNGVLIFWLVSSMAASFLMLALWLSERAGMRTS